MIPPLVIIITEGVLSMLLRSLLQLTLAGCLVLDLHAAQGEITAQERVPEKVYEADMVTFPGPWAFQLHKSHIILVTDQELRDLEDPDKAINLSLGHTPDPKSLRQICEAAKAAGHNTLILAFDHFFSQYRPGLGDQPRELTPDKPEYIKRIAAISQFAAGYGLGLELSFLTPLEIGSGYENETGEWGRWMHYRKGLRDAESGAYSVELWRHKKWANNKGAIDVQDAGIRVFAFREEAVQGTRLRAVDPKSIVEISDGAQVEVLDPKVKMLERIRVYGKGHGEIGPLGRVLVVQIYKAPEMDYFSEKALPYLTHLVDRYADAGVQLNGLYSDEMHIQQDWAYFGHHDHGEFAVRYVSPGLEKEFARRYGEEYRDLAKYLVYFTYGQEDFAHDLTAKAGVGHVFGASAEGIRQTALFRARYYQMLQNGVVDLFTSAKRHAEKRMGRRLSARAHATWAESPTIDSWYTGEQKQDPHKYEYTSNFVWSDTVHQAAAACYDIFKWGDFLTGNGNDHAEGGWLDRDYYAHALACSTGLINEVPYSYAAHWGMPGEISQRRAHINDVFGSSASAPFSLVQDMQHRQVEVLMLYPLDLVAVEERFGSWMTQYAYADMITASKLLELGKVVDGGIEVAGRKFTTLATQFEPFPSKALLDMMREFVLRGGRLIWSGPPPLVTWEGQNALQAWCDLFGVEYRPGLNEGILAPGRSISFEGVLSNVSPQIILTDFLVDHIYPVTPQSGTAATARSGDLILGTHRAWATGGGSATFLGYRPRDDQSKSLGYETRNWFEVLDALGAYPGTGRFARFNDNPEHLSRTTDFLACRFPNGTVAVARHFREFVEDWPGGFARDPERDKEVLREHPLPPDEISLQEFGVDGWHVTYEGTGAVAFRMDEGNNLTGFAGRTCSQISVNGHTVAFADRKMPLIAWAPVQDQRRKPGGGVLQIMAHGTGKLSIPTAGLPKVGKIVAEGGTPGSRGAEIPMRIEGGDLLVEITPEISGRWLFGVE
jgi:hypothetical protein